MGSQYLGLGLFIILLSFFIVINSMSKFDASKTQAVVRSLSDAFVPQYSLQNDLSSQFLNAPGEDMSEGDSLDDIEALFRSTIVDIKAQKSRFGDTLRMRLSRESFEKALWGEGDDSDRFAQTLSSLLTADDGNAYEMDIVLSVENNPAQLAMDYPATERALVNQVGRYGAVLEGRGVSPHLITTGLGKGTPDNVYLVFRRYLPVRLEAVDIGNEAVHEP